MGGVIVLGGLLVRGIAEYVSALAMTLLGLSVDPAWLAPAVVLVLTVNSVLSWWMWTCSGTGRTCA